jgi:hypothetical protein
MLNMTVRKSLAYGSCATSVGNHLPGRNTGSLRSALAFLTFLFSERQAIGVILYCMDPKFRRVIEALFWFSLGVVTYACLIHLHHAR